MPENIKKVLLQKVVSDTLYSIYPKTQADIVVYTKTVDSEEISTTVAAELLALANQGSADLTTAKNYTDEKVSQLENTIKGLSENESLVEAFDTLKEIGDWLENAEGSSASTILNDISDLKLKVGVPTSGTEGQEGYVEATGLFNRVEALEARQGNHVEDSATNGNILVGVPGSMSEVNVYDDTELRLRVGHAAVGTVGQDGYEAPTGLFADIANLSNGISGDLGDLENSDITGATVADKFNTVNGIIGSSSDTASASTVYGAIAAVDDKYDEKIGDLDDAVSGSTVTAKFSTIDTRIGNTADTTVAGTSAVAKINTLNGIIGSSSDTATASTVYGAIAAVQDDVDALHTLQVVSTVPADPDANILYLVELA